MIFAPAVFDKVYKGVQAKVSMENDSPSRSKSWNRPASPGAQVTLDEFEVLDDDAGRSLGKGSFGVVRRIRRKGTDDVYALKTMQKIEVIEGDLIDQVEREIQVQRTLKHENVLRLYKHFEDDDSVYLLLEYCAKGELYQLLRTRRGRRFPEDVAQHYFVQTARGLQYLHGRNIVHRDLKPENLLVNHDDVLKIADFGWCAVSDNLRTTFCGTLDYLAPEMVQGHGHNHTLDLWSLGVLLYEMVVGRPPFQSTDHAQLISKILSLDIRYTAFVSLEVQELVKALLQKDPAERLALDLVLRHRWCVRQITPAQDLSGGLNESFGSGRAQSMSPMEDSTKDKDNSRCARSSSVPVDPSPTQQPGPSRHTREALSASRKHADLTSPRSEGGTLDASPTSVAGGSPTTVGSAAGYPGPGPGRLGPTANSGARSQSRSSTAAQANGQPQSSRTAPGSSQAPNGATNPITPGNSPWAQYRGSHHQNQQQSNQGPRQNQSLPRTPKPSVPFRGLAPSQGATGPATTSSTPSVSTVSGPMPGKGGSASLPMMPGSNPGVRDSAGRHRISNPGVSPSGGTSSNSLASGAAGAGTAEAVRRGMRSHRPESPHSPLMKTRGSTSPSAAGSPSWQDLMAKQHSAQTRSPSNYSQAATSSAPGTQRTGPGHRSLSPTGSGTAAPGTRQPMNFQQSSLGGPSRPNQAMMNGSPQGQAGLMPTSLAAAGMTQASAMRGMQPVMQPGVGLAAAAARRLG